MDTSFHFETAAAAAKRISGSQELGPLEIDVSDSNLESGDEKEIDSKNKKRKHGESETEPEGKRKKKKNTSGNLLTTFSPRSTKKSTNVTKDSDHDEVSQNIRTGLIEKFIRLKSQVPISLQHDVVALCFLLGKISKALNIKSLRT